ncbi:Myb-like_DNA-binding domain-containing protein [Hexamita inflata]|uniref:Myb-like DNA-binding domain-containing protein n=1 Tax=Hexamita inflata TaxID=28002 RepID=A0AA86PRS1_9EUKA|nr:Myb-like DNA-binding domain-containing protein [Hexamita inflata]
MKQFWSESEKVKLSELILLNTAHSRTNWKLVASQLQNRTPTQCKLQYRNVLCQTKLEKVNFEWTDEKSIEFEMLFMIYGNKWSFIQLNYYPELKPEQLQLKYQYLKGRQTEYNALKSKISNNEQLTDKEVQLCKFVLHRIKLTRQKLAELEQNKSVLFIMDPLMTKFLKEVVTDEYKIGMNAEEQTMIEAVKQNGG